MSAARPAPFVVLEGIDGAGTSTQARRLVERLQRDGKPARLTHEPSDGPLGVWLRRALSGEHPPPEGGWAALTLLFAADRLDHLSREIEPALQSGVVVVSDRYDLSSLAYQSATSEDEGQSLPWIRNVNARARRPDLTIVLDVSAEVAERRRAQRGGPAELFEKTQLQQRLAHIYRQAQNLVPSDRIVLIPGDAAVDRVEMAIWTAVRAVIDG